MTAQEQAIRINAIKVKVDKTRAQSNSKLCGKVDERVRHIVCECSMLLQMDYKRSHD